MSDEQYKSLLIINESKDASITLYIYASCDFVCWMSFRSKIIPPGEKYLHRSKDSFKFKLVARFKDKPKQTLLKPKTWYAEKLFKVTEDLRLTEGKLEDFPSEKQVCLRKLQRDKELNTTSGKRNLYAILGLDMDQIRHMPREEQKEAIKKGFREQIKRWHPDKNFGDEDIAKEIIMAQAVLLDDERRARYHNEADYDKGWLHLSRWRAIFNPERFTIEQKKAYKKRMRMFAASLGIAFGGIVLTAVTAGLAVPAVVPGGVIGCALMGGGLQSLPHTVNEKSVVTEECDTKKWLLKAGIGFVSGAAIGGARVGITAGVVGLGSSAMKSAAVTMGQYVGIGAGTGAVGGAVSSIASDAGRKFVDGEEVTLKQAVCRVAFGATIGAVTGIEVGAVSKAVVSGRISAATTNIKGDVGEHVAMLTGGRRLGNALARKVLPALTESGAESVMGTAAQFVEERLDDSVENQSPGQHLVRGAVNSLCNAIKVGVRDTAAGLLSHAGNEIIVSKKVKKSSDVDKTERHRLKGKMRQKLSLENNEHRVKYQESTCSATYQPLESEKLLEDEMYPSPTIYEEADVPSEQMDPLSANEYVNPVVDIDGEVGLNDSRGQVKHERFEENKEHLIKLGESAYSPTNQPLESDQLLENETSPLSVVSEEACVLEKRESDQREDIKIKYISEGAWISRMIVSFFLDGKKTTQPVSEIDDSVENQSPGQHLVRGATNLGCNAIKVGVRDTATGLLTHAKNEVIVSKGVKKSSDVDKTERSCLKREERQKLSLENNENLVKYQESNCSATYQPLESEKLLEDETAVVSEEACVLEEHESDQLEDMDIKYISDGKWTSRMIVSFFLDGKKTMQQVSGSGKFVTIPSRARDIEVKFQVRRPFWGDVMKYNRFKEAWFQPYEPHVFGYEKPTNRTFTISGNLWWEAVMGVTDEHHDETKEL